MNRIQYLLTTANNRAALVGRKNVSSHLPMTYFRLKISVKSSKKVLDLIHGRCLYEGHSKNTRNFSVTKMPARKIRIFEC